MNDAVFVIAVLFEKGILTKKEAAALRDMASKETFTASLQEMITKVGIALKTGQRRETFEITEVDAKDII